MRLAILALLCLVASAQPVVSKVEPPDWWTGTMWNPVQLLIRGQNLKGAKVGVRAPLKTGEVKVNAAGTYLRVEVRIPSKASAGAYPVTISTAEGKVEAPFRLFERLKADTRFQGFSTDDVIYLIMPDRFANGDAANDDPAESKGLHDRSKVRYYHGGDLQGVIDKLDYLKELGVTAIWLNPWYENSNILNEKETYNGQAITDYHGYGATDFYGVEEHFGTLEKLVELVDKAHANGIKIIQDQVANHTGPYHPWVKDAPSLAWYHGTSADHAANDWQTWTLADPHGTPATRRTTLDGWFINILPDLNQEDIDVTAYLIQNSLWWVGRTGLDAIRQDTLPYALRTYWAAWMRALKGEFPRVNVVGEVFDGNPALVAFFQGGAAQFDGVDSGIDSVFDFPVYFQIRSAFGRGGSLRDIPRMMSHDRLYPDSSLLVTFLGLHDVERFMNEKGATAEGLKLAWTFLFTARGVPLIYYGDEVGMRGGNDPDNRRDFPGGWQGDARNAFTATGRTPDEQAMFDHVKKLAALRRTSTALKTGATTNLVSTDQTWAYLRRTPRQTAIVVLNNGVGPAAVEFDSPVAGQELRDALGSAAVLKIQSGRARVDMPARSSAIFVP